LVKTLNEAVQKNGDQELKAFFIFVSEDGTALSPKLAAMAEKAKANDVALAYISPKDYSLGAYKINLVPEVKNTVILYRNKRVTSKFVNIKADEKGLAELQTAVSELVK